MGLIRKLLTITGDYPFPAGPPQSYAEIGWDRTLRASSNYRLSTELVAALNELSTPDHVPSWTGRLWVQENESALAELDCYSAGIDRLLDSEAAPDSSGQRSYQKIGHIALFKRNPRIL